METLTGPAPALRCNLSLLIWPWNARYPHSPCLGRASSPATATRRAPHLSKWGWGIPFIPPLGAGFPPRYCWRIGDRVGGDPSSSRIASAAPASRHAGDRGLSAWRLERLTGRVGGGGGNPRVSQPVPKEGARFRRSVGPPDHAGPTPRASHLRAPKEIRITGAI